MPTLKTLFKRQLISSRLKPLAGFDMGQFIGRFGMMFLLVGMGSTGLAQPTDKPIKLMAMLRKLHVQPRTLDSNTTNLIMQDWLAAADPYRVYLDAATCRRLTVLGSGLHQFTPAQIGGLLDSATRYLYAGRIGFYKNAEGLLAKPLDYTRKDSIELAEKLPPPNGAAALAKRQRQFITWAILDALGEAWERQQEDTAKQVAALFPPTTDAWFTEQEAEIRQAQTERYATGATRFKADSATLRTKVEYLLLNAIAAVFDPHSNYFDTEDEEAFEGSLSSVNSLFGFRLKENSKGEISIGELLPGSPAWNSGQIYEGDQLMAVTLPNGATTSTTTNGAKAVMEVIDAANDVEVVFTLKSADGKEKKITLRKEPVANTDNLVRGYLLKGAKNIGYIALPSFYTTHDGEGTGVAGDLSKELIKLKREKIEGLILDLRYNGGGSMAEAAAMAGIFIDLGPISLVKNADGSRVTMKDPSRGLTYDGPLTVLINGQSASASELVAGVLQDYKRATIVGSSSFGKATMQLVLPLDSSLPANREKLGASLAQLNYEPKEFVKITTGRFYRITGQTHQMSGVVPDVLLPDPFEVMDYTERNMPYALKPDTISIATSFTSWPVSNPSPQQSISVEEDPFFKDLKSWIAQEKKRKHDFLPLEWKAYMAERQKTDPPNPKSQAYQAVAMAYSPANTSYTEKLLDMETSASKALNLRKIETLTKDHYINAAYKLLINR